MNFDFEEFKTEWLVFNDPAGLNLKSFEPFKLGEQHKHTVHFNLIALRPRNGYTWFIAPFMGFTPYRPDRCNVIIGLS